MTEEVTNMFLHFWLLVFWWGPTKAFYHSVNVHRVLILFAGGGDTQPLDVIIKLFVVTGGEDPKNISCPLLPIAPSYSPSPLLPLTPLFPLSQCGGHPKYKITLTPHSLCPLAPSSLPSPFAPSCPLLLTRWWEPQNPHSLTPPCPLSLT